MNEKKKKKKKDILNRIMKAKITKKQRHRRKISFSFSHRNGPQGNTDHFSCISILADPVLS